MRTSTRSITGAAPVPARGGDVVNGRGGAPNTFGKLARGEKTTVVYFGGSITALPFVRFSSSLAT